MIHRLSRIGGSLCSSTRVPLTAKYGFSGEVWITDEPGGACEECNDLHVTHIAAARRLGVEFGPLPRLLPPLPAIVSAEIQCPRCNRFHVDREEWYHKLHHCHRCEHCGHDFEYTPDPLHKYSRGIEPVSVRGRLAALKHAFADWLYERLS